MANIGYYYQDIDHHLLMFCLANGNEIFLKYALKLQAFDTMIFRKDDVINHFITLLKEGARTNYLLNILTLIDLGLWKNKQLRDLIDVFSDYGEDSYDKNKLLLSYNPLMSIALTCELLSNIGNKRKKLENECMRVKRELMELGKMYSVKIEDERFYEALIQDEDFKSRSLIKIITEKGLEPLMDEEDPKAENMMLSIWHGKEATRCDGNISGYSSLTHVLKSTSKKLTGSASSFFKLISNYFQPNYKVDYQI